MRGFKHMDAYLDELEWRFNNRDSPGCSAIPCCAYSKSSMLNTKNLVIKIGSSLARMSIYDYFNSFKAFSSPAIKASAS